jgi:metallo-beta-lactamase family protein
MTKKTQYKIFILCLFLISFSLSATLCFSQSGFPSIRFLGAAQMVGGSCYLIDTGKTRMLIDFGRFYGKHEERNSVIDFDAAKIDFVLITHAHIDHAGRIPLHYKKGFKGKTIGTDATKSLSGIILEMSLGLAEKQGESIYDYGDYTRMMDNFMVVPLNQILNLNSEVSVRFRNAGHILGSSIIELWIQGKDQTIKIVATGDLGNESMLLLKGPDIVHEGDYILVESTAGAVRRADADFTQFGKEIRKTLKMGGSILIPAFVLDRTQSVLYIIGKLKRQGIIPQETPVYVDSGTAQKITDIYRKYGDYFHPEASKHVRADKDLFTFPHLYEMISGDALMMHNRGQPAIYISSSAMLDHANAPKHLERMIEDPKNLLAIVGWQAPDTPGWKLQKGAKYIWIPLESYVDGKLDVKYAEKSVKMRVKTFGMFSYHADGCQILRWLSNFSEVKEVFVVHGESSNAVDLAEIITERLGFKASAPELGAISHLSANAKKYANKRIPDLCSGMRASSRIGDSSER